MHIRKTGRFRYKVVSLQVISIRTQAAKLHTNFVHFKRTLRSAPEQEKQFG